MKKNNDKNEAYFESDNSIPCDYEIFVGELISVKSSRIFGHAILKFRNEEKTISVYLGKQAALQLDMEELYEVGHCGKKVINIK